MGSIFATGQVPTFSKEQQKMRKAAWKPHTSRAEVVAPGSAVAVYRSPKAQAEYEARVAAEAQAKAEKRAATLAKMAATRAAKKAAKAKVKAKA
jgi:hypothetical protein